MTAAAETTGPEWLVVGGLCYVKTGVTMSDTYTQRTIVRLTKRDVVLDNGERFPRAQLRRYLPGRFAGSLLLLGPSDPAALNAIERQRVERIRNDATTKATRLLEQWRRTGDVGPAREAANVIAVALSEIRPSAVSS